MSGTQRTVTIDLREGMEAIAGFYAPAHHDKALARIGADIDALPDPTNATPDPWDGGCPADVTADEAHGGRGGTMGDAAAAMPPRKWTLDDVRDLPYAVDDHAAAAAECNAKATQSEVRP